jgi:hypothetical protein
MNLIRRYISPHKSEFLALVAELPLAYKTKKVVEIGSLVEILQ